MAHPVPPQSSAGVGAILGTFWGRCACMMAPTIYAVYAVSAALAEGEARRTGSTCEPLAPIGRIWCDSADAPWRALSRDAKTGEEHRFATIEQLFLFLHRQTQGRETAGEDDEAK